MENDCYCIGIGIGSISSAQRRGFLKIYISNRFFRRQKKPERTERAGNPAAAAAFCCIEKRDIREGESTDRPADNRDRQAG